MDAPERADTGLPGDIAKNFESLGGNCEFGLLQRTFGVEPLGLYRFNVAPMDKLLLALETRFDEVGDPGNVEVYWNDREYMIRDSKFGFDYHTFVTNKESDVAKLHETQVKIIRYLKNKLISDLEDAEKIFVRLGRGADSQTQEQILPLFQALRRYGQNTLLWVVTSDGKMPPGTVEVLQDGLLKGYVDKFATFGDATVISIEAWYHVCRNAYLIWRGGKDAAFQAPEEFPRLMGNAADFGGWFGSDSATNKRVYDIPVRPTKSRIMAHRLVRATEVGNHGIYHCCVENGIVPGKAYTASAWVWIPDSYVARNYVTGDIGIGFHGCPRFGQVVADMSRRNVWQRVWGSTIIPRDLFSAQLTLYALGEEGAAFYSTDWQLVQHIVPPPEAAA